MSHVQPDVIIIGAGIGGLSAAIDLCTRGFRVTLLEQHHAVGGKMHETEVAGHRIDTGPTVFTMRSVLDNLLTRAGYQLDDLVDIVQADVLARHFWKDSPPLDLFSQIEKTCTSIASFSSPNEASNYRQFARRSEALFHALDDCFMQAERPGPIAMGINAGLRNLATVIQSAPFQTLWRSLCLSFEDPRLRQLFSRYSTYCGSSPFKAPATLMLIAHAERAGVWMLRQGMYSLAKALEKVILEQGGDIRVNCKVEAITCVDGAVSGVRLSDQTYLEAKQIIFNGDTGALTQGLLGDDVTDATKPANELSLAAITLATVGRVEGLDLSYHNVFFGSDYRAEFDAIFAKRSICNDPTIYVCAQDRMATQPSITSATSNRPERLFCLMNAPATDLSDDSVRRESKKILSTLADHGATITHCGSEPAIAHPRLFDQRFPGSKGALYGQPTHGAMGSFRRLGSRSNTKGLYLAGGSVHPGAGVPMVCLSGQRAAQSVDDDRRGW